MRPCAVRLRHDDRVTLYAPTAAEVRAVALQAQLRNSHPSARDWLLDKLDQPARDWDARAILSVPGVVWTVSSDTCATGHLSAPDNVGYDHCFREFVFRQPRDASELAALMSADSEEVFACYRFDGLNRWTSQSIAAWHEDLGVVRGYADHAIATSKEAEVVRSLRRYRDYVCSPEFGEYLSALRAHLDALGRTGRPNRTTPESLNGLAPGGA